MLKKTVYLFFPLENVSSAKKVFYSWEMES